jgi:ubiquinone/menaquinone biosynthesis C-methylase UbiE
MAEIKDKEEIREYYKGKSTVDMYIKKRFSEPIGIIKHKKQVDFINKFIREKRLKKVLEIACGPARLTTDVNLLDKGYAIDSSETMLQIAAKRLKRNNKWKLLKGNAFDIKFNKNSFDLVFTFRFLRHFEKKDRERLYKEIRRILKPDSYLIFDVLNTSRNQIIQKIRKMKGTSKVYEIDYYKKNFIKEIENNGFRVITMKPIINHFFREIFISKIGVWFGFRKLSLRLLKKMEKTPGNCWEWVVLCQKK